MSSRSPQDIDSLASDYGNHFTPDVENGLARLHRTIDIDRSGAKVRRLNIRHYLSIAAGILLLITAFFYFSGDDQVILNDTDQPMAVALPDGSKVILQQGSSISYDGADAGWQPGNPSLSQDAERRVEINGQGFFTVAKDPSRPFLVTGGNTTLRVTGTEFNLRIEDEELEVEVSEGSVELDFEDGTLPIAAKQCGIAKAGARPVMMDAPNLNRHAWRTGQLVFENASLADVITTLHNNWDVEVSLPDGCDYPISGNWKSKDPSAILDGIAKLGGGSCKSKGNNRFDLLDVCKD